MQTRDVVIKSLGGADQNQFLGGAARGLFRTLEGGGREIAEPVNEINSVAQRLTMSAHEGMARSTRFGALSL